LDGAGTWGDRGAAVRQPVLDARASGGICGAPCKGCPGGAVVGRRGAAFGAVGARFGRVADAATGPGLFAAPGRHAVAPLAAGKKRWRPPALRLLVPRAGGGLAGSSVEVKE
jgi:hypothetical protein